MCPTSDWIEVGYFPKSPPEDSSEIGERLLASLERIVEAKPPLSGGFLNDFLAVKVTLVTHEIPVCALPQTIDRI